MTRSFVCTLIGIGMTLLAWYGPWGWPAWPAFTVLHLAFGSGEVYENLDHGWRAVVLVVLIVINVGFWAAVAYGSQRLAGSVRRRANT